MKWLFFFFISINCHAKVFTNSYLTFNLPDDWDCVLAGTEWVCSPSSKSGQREATIILGAKSAGPEDRIENFQKFLNNPKTVQLANGTTAPSKVIKVAPVQLGEQTWIEGIHLGSEIENYYTRYLATVKEHLSILMTMSAHKSVWNNYEPIFGKLKNSIKISASPQLLIRPPEKRQPPASLPNVSNEIPTMESPVVTAKHQPIWKQPFMVLSALISLIVIGLAFWLRKK